MSTPGTTGDIINARDRPVAGADVDFRRRSIRQVDLHPIRAVATYETQPKQLYTTSYGYHGVVPDAIINIPTVSLRDFSYHHTGCYKDAQQPQPGLAGTAAVRGRVTGTAAGCDAFDRPGSRDPSPGRCGNPVTRRRTARERTDATDVRLEGIPVHSPHFPIYLASLVDNVVTTLPR